MLSLFIVSVLAAIGLTEIIVRGRIFMEWRERRSGLIKALVSCPQCTGFWAGLFVSMAAYLNASYPDLTPYTGWNCLVFGLLAAFTASWLAWVVDTFTMKKIVS